jgi:hypothetical protein
LLALKINIHPRLTSDIISDIYRSSLIQSIAMTEQAFETDVTKIPSVGAKVWTAVYLIAIGVATVGWVGLIAWFGLALLGF